jgi:hypothetical protein
VTERNESALYDYVRYRAEMVLVGMSPETEATLTEKWPEWREHITTIDVGVQRDVSRPLIEHSVPTDLHQYVLNVLKSMLAQELVKRIEPRITTQERSWSFTANGDFLG